MQISEEKKIVQKRRCLLSAMSHIFSLGKMGLRNKRTVDILNQQKKNIFSSFLIKKARGQTLVELVASGKSTQLFFLAVEE